MPTGFQSFTDGGVLQIDSEKKCYVLKQAARGTSDSARIFVLRIPLGISPLVFFHEADGALQSVYINGNERSYVFYSRVPNQEVRFYHYDVISGSTSNVGFQLFNSAGEITFDAAQRPLALHASVPNVAPNNNASTPINVARSYAVCLTTVPLVTEQAPSRPANFRNFFICLPERSGSNLVFTKWNYRSGVTWSPISLNMAPVNALVMDVTNIPTVVWTPPPFPAGFFQATAGFSSQGTNNLEITGYDALASVPYGSIQGQTSFNGAAIRRLVMNRFLPPTNIPNITFTVTMLGNRALNFFTTLQIAGFGNILSASATRSYDATGNTTTWIWQNQFDVTVIQGLGMFQGTFT